MSNYNFNLEIPPPDYSSQSQWRSRKSSSPFCVKCDPYPELEVDTVSWSWSPPLSLSPAAPGSSYRGLNLQWKSRLSNGIIKCGQWAIECGISEYYDDDQTSTVNVEMLSNILILDVQKFRYR